LIGLVLEKLL
jgi:hypothetical protein